MSDKRKNIKVDPATFKELDKAREMTWNDQLLYWKRMAEVKDE